MTTLGDPLVDLGTLLNYWPDPVDPEATRARHQPGLAHMGLPTRAEITARYAARDRRRAWRGELVGGVRALEDRGGRGPAAPPPLGARRVPPTRGWRTSPTGLRASCGRPGSCWTPRGSDRVHRRHRRRRHVHRSHRGRRRDRARGRHQGALAPAPGGRRGPRRPRGPRHRQRGRTPRWSTAPPWAPTRCSSAAGRRVAVLTTAGFRDLIEIGRTKRNIPALFVPTFVRPKPVVERKHRFEVTERLGADGSVLVPLDMASSSARSTRALAADAEAIAVCLLHAYLNPGARAARGRRGQGPAPRPCPSRARPTWSPSTASSSASRPPCSTPISSR